MGRRGCESFLKGLKEENAYRTENRDLADVHTSIGVFLEEAHK